jgi:hypothetical protein
MDRMSFKVASLLVAAGFAGASFATPITVLNPIFEADALADDTDDFTNESVTDWVGLDPDATAGNFSFGVVDPQLGNPEPTDGENWGYMVNGGLSQTLSAFSAGVGDTITVTFDAIINNGTTDLVVDFAGIGAQSVPNADLNTTTATSVSLDFVVTSAITEGLLSFQNNGAGSQVRIDAVSVELTPVPEPGSLALLGLGGLALLRRRRA